MRTTHVMNVNTKDPERVCQAIRELDELYKDLNVITIIKEGLNNFVYYQIGRNSARGEKWVTNIPAHV